LVFGENQKAIGALTKGRAGLPEYKYYGDIHTPAILLGFPKKRLGSSGIQFQTAREEQMPEVFAFFNKMGKQKQFTPVWLAGDLNGPHLQGLEPKDFYVGIKNGKIVACAAAWDISNVQQLVVEKYSWQLRVLKTLYNPICSVSNLNRFPRVGGAILGLYLSFVAVENNDPEIFRLLFRHIYRDRSRGQWMCLYTGFHERDPLGQVLEDYPKVTSRCHLYQVKFKSPSPEAVVLDDRIPYVEMVTM